MSPGRTVLLAALALSGCVTAPAAPPWQPPPEPVYLQPLPPPPPPRPDPQRALTWASHFVPPELHAPLGLTAEGLAAQPPAPRDDEERARAEVSRQVPAAEACLPVFATPLPDGKAHRSPVEAWAALTLGPDGRPRDVVVRLDSATARPEDERCAAEAIGRWALGQPRLGGRIWVALRGRGPEVLRPPAADRPEEPAWRDPSAWSAPSPKEPGCVARSVRVPRAFQGLVANAVVRFAVGRDGQVSRFRVISPPDLPVEVAVAIFQAVRDCEWTPGRNPAREPASIWVLQPFRFLTR